MSNFRDLHAIGNPFVLANAWDRGSAKMLEALGAKAIGTSSAAQAFTHGLTDGGTISRDDALAHAQELMSVVKIPVSGDFENGFGDTPEDCAETVRLSAEIGLAGICIEDTGFPLGEPYEFKLAVERMKAAADAAKQAKKDFFFVARADGVMTQKYDLDEAIRRIQAFDAAGVDGLYVPALGSLEDVKRVVNATEKPVNVLAVGAMSQHSLADFATLGVARISMGSALARTTYRVIHDNTKAMLEDGNFTSLANGLPFSELNPLLLQPN